MDKEKKIYRIYNIESPKWDRILFEDKFKYSMPFAPITEAYHIKRDSNGKIIFKEKIILK